MYNDYVAAAQLIEQYRSGLDEGRPQARASLGLIGNKYTVDWTQYAHVDMTERVQTNVTPERLATWLRAVTRERLLAMAMAARKLRKADATQRVADTCIAVAQMR